MRAHTLHRERHFRRILLGKERTLQAVAIETPQQGHFLPGCTRRTLHPLTVGHLKCQNVRRGLREPEVELRGAARLYRCRCRLECVSGGTYCPCALVLTETMMVEPGRLALTTTPSIFPSSGEETVPVSAVGPRF
jgi:hypothetical protein